MNNQSSSNDQYFYHYMPNQANDWETPQQFVVPSDPPRTRTRNQEIHPTEFYISPEAVSPVSIRPYQPQMQMGHLPPIPGPSNPIQASYIHPYVPTSPLSYSGYIQVGSPNNGTLVAASPTSSTGTSSSQGHNSTSKRPKPVHRCKICGKEYDKPNRAQTCENRHEDNRLYICNGDCGVHSW
ncbi:6181_t:CDS:1 [Acaulospora colombiana]|uniref:6181_t:CDS:1 n=1 Tax=Acaulospora colombiana TaxID=27376 RepID=A0ACA9LYX3_9GLOM|nr:6181_t:CDS:1 [Acaulospora colombiana]